MGIIFSKKYSESSEPSNTTFRNVKYDLEKTEWVVNDDDTFKFNQNSTTCNTTDIYEHQPIQIVIVSHKNE